MADKIAFYGDPRGPHGVDEHWFAQNIVRVIPPYQMTYAGQSIKTVSFHRKCAPALSAALGSIWEHCGKKLEQVKSYHLDEFGGSFNYRLIRGSTNLSNHSFGIAIDIAPAGNALGVTHGAMPQFAVLAFKAQGFKWGGDYLGRKDWMHFEAVT